MDEKLLKKIRLAEIVYQRAKSELESENASKHLSKLYELRDRKKYQRGLK